MKKIFILLALLASVQIGNAQSKAAADAQKALDAAISASQNAKKATKAATWVKLGEAYLKAYEAPASKVWQGASKQELSLVMGEQPKSTETVEIGGQQMTKEVYEDKELYFTQNGQLSIIKVTKPVVKDALDKALEAFAKAQELGGDAKSLDANLKAVNQKFNQEAFNAYQFGDFATASVAFENAVKALGQKPLSQLDTNSLYNAAFTAWQVKDGVKAQKLFKQCLENNYFGEGGEVYAKLAEIDTVNAKNYLQDGFTKFPESQSILIGLINYYLQHNEDPDELFALLDKAKKNEPNNASLYYVEGNIRTQLKDYDNAVKAYEKCAEIDPTYAYGYIGEGIMYYNRALDLQKAAQDELDDAKYEKIVNEFSEALKNCIAPFEKAFNVSKDDSVKVSIAEYLKNAYYRFRSDSAENQAAYDKYDKIVKEGKVE